MIAVGTDIVQVERIAAICDRFGDRFAARILTATELAGFRSSAQPQRLLARRFAAKEAVAKTLGSGIGAGVSWQHIEIQHDSLGAPTVLLRETALSRAQSAGGSRVLLSVSDELRYVVAFAALVA